MSKERWEAREAGFLWYVETPSGDVICRVYSEADAKEICQWHNDSIVSIPILPNTEQFTRIDERREKAIMFFMAAIISSDSMRGSPEVIADAAAIYADAMIARMDKKV